MRHNIEFWDADSGFGTTVAAATFILIAASSVVLFVCAVISNDYYNAGELVVNSAPAIWKLFFGLLILGVANLVPFAFHYRWGLDSDDKRLLDSFYALPKSVRKEYKIKRSDLLNLSRSERVEFIKVADERAANERKFGPVGNLVQDLKSSSEVYRELS